MLLVLLMLSYLIGTLNYVFSSLILVVLVPTVVLNSGSFFTKFMVLMIYVGGAIVFIMHISCLRVNNFSANPYLISFLSFPPVKDSSFLNTGTIDVNFVIIPMVSLMFNFILLLYSTNPFKIPGSTRP